MTEALASGMELLSINSPAAVPIDGTKGTVFAIPTKINQVAVQIRPVGVYTALSVAIQLSNVDEDANYATAYTLVDVTGGLVTILGVAARFIRVVMNSSAGAARVGMVVGIVGD